MSVKRVLVTGAFDDLRSGQIRFLQEAAKLGDLAVLLWSDDLVQRVQGKAPKFPQAEREYMLRALRFVRRVHPMSDASRGLGGASNGRSPQSEVIGSVLADVPGAGGKPGVVVVNGLEDTHATRSACEARGIECRVLGKEDLIGFPEAAAGWAGAPGLKRVIVTGCYDWVHSGHVRFFEEVSAYGDLYVVLGHDANLRLLKGPGHPHFPQEERRYVVSAIRYVKQALISSGTGWLDAEPEIERIKPDIYAVNEDGDRGGKREYCTKNGIEYLVLKRSPAPGLPRRTSTELRGF
jgi:cytidyltransferase-like protein